MSGRQPPHPSLRVYLKKTIHHRAIRAYCWDLQPQYSARHLQRTAAVPSLTLCVPSFGTQKRPTHQQYRRRSHITHVWNNPSPFTHRFSWL